MVRVDWNIAPTTTFYSRVNFGYEAFKGGWGFVLNNANWPQLPIAYEIHSYGVVNTLLHTFSPTLVAEVTVGLNHGKQTVEPLTEADCDRNIRGNVGLGGLPWFFPGANPDGIVPNVFFTTRRRRRHEPDASGVGLANMPTLGVEGRYPFFGENDIWNTSIEHDQDVGSHNLKAGVFIEYTTRPAARSTQFNGAFNFDHNTANPLNTSHPYANAHPRVGQQLLGSHGASGRPRASSPTSSGSSRTTGASSRTSRSTPASASIASGRRRARAISWPMFLPELFDPANAPLLIQPVNTANGRRGLNPLTGEILPAVKIGTFVPGSGNPSNGIQVFDEKVLDTPPIQVAPRIGFSWDVTGDGKTAIRGGFGMFPDRFNDDIVLQLVELPPLVNTPTANYTTIRELLATPLSLSPATARYVNPDYKPQYTYN